MIFALNCFSVIFSDIFHVILNAQTISNLLPETSLVKYPSDMIRSNLIPEIAYKHKTKKNPTLTYIVKPVHFLLRSKSKIIHTSSNKIGKLLKFTITR